MQPPSTGVGPPELQASNKGEQHTSIKEMEKEIDCLPTDHSQTTDLKIVTAKAISERFVTRKRRRCSVLPETDPRKKVRFDAQKRLFASQSTDQTTELESLIQQFKETSL